jgi:uncharacterized protein YeaO (DUF488 family)
MARAARHPEISTARVYGGDVPGTGGAARVLVDRLWPRGLAKARAGDAFDEWCKAVSPSTELRHLAHDPGHYEEFRAAYEAELDDAEHAAALKHLRELADAHGGRLVLVTAAKDVEHSHVPVIAGRLAGTAR